MNGQWTAYIAGLACAAISVYWELGGTWLLDTVGGALARQGRAGTLACCSRCGPRRP